MRSAIAYAAGFRGAGSGLQDLDERLRRMDLQGRMGAARARLAAGSTASMKAIESRLQRARGELAPLSAQLRQLSPLNVLERGYAIVQLEGGVVVRDAEQAPEGTPIDVRVARGDLKAVVS